MKLYSVSFNTVICAETKEMAENVICRLSADDDDTVFFGEKKEITKADDIPAGWDEDMHPVVRVQGSTKTDLSLYSIREILTLKEKEEARKKIIENKIMLLEKELDVLRLSLKNY
jgi:hypothetical protein